MGDIALPYAEAGTNLMWSRGRRFDVHVTTLAARHCLHARLPSPTPRPCRFWRPVGVGARQSCAEWPFSDDRGVRSREEMRSTHRRRRRSHSSRQAFRHFGTRLTPVHRMNGPRAIGVRRPSCSYLCLAVPSGSQASLSGSRLCVAGCADSATASSRRGMARSGSLALCIVELERHAR